MIPSSEHQDISLAHGKGGVGKFFTTILTASFLLICLCIALGFAALTLLFLYVTILPPETTHPLPGGMYIVIPIFAGISWFFFYVLYRLINPNYRNKPLFHPYFIGGFGLMFIVTGLIVGILQPEGIKGGAGMIATGAVLWANRKKTVKAPQEPAET